MLLCSALALTACYEGLDPDLLYGDEFAGTLGETSGSGGEDGNDDGTETVARADCCADSSPTTPQ